MTSFARRGGKARFPSFRTKCETHVDRWAAAIASSTALHFSLKVGYDDGADRASHDTDVSIAP